MRHRCMECAIALTMIASGVTMSMADPPTILMPGVAPSEASVFVKLMTLATTDEEAAVQMSRDILRRDPKNAVVLFFQVGQFSRMGKLDEASRSLALLREQKPGWILGWQAEVDLLDVMGEYKKEADALETFMRKEFQDPLEAAVAEGMRASAPARLAELRGKMEDAEAVWKTLIDDKKAGDAERSARMVEMGRFYLRHSLDAKAEGVLVRATETGEGAMSDDAKADALLPLVTALWAQGRVDQAVAKSKDLLRICGRLPLDSDVCLQALLTSYVLFKKADDKASAGQAEALLKKAAGMDAMAKRITGLAPLVRDKWKRQDVRDVAERTRRVLKDAPRLDWARWTALYLAIENPAEHEGLLKALPDDSVQRRIYRQLAKTDSQSVSTSPASGSE